MIYVDIHGRLGNQMFQYAFARWLQLKTTDIICIGFQDVEVIGTKEQGWENALQYFSTSNFIIDKGKKSILKSKSTPIQKILGMIYLISFAKYRNNHQIDKRRAIQMRWQKVLNRFGLYWIVTGYTKPVISTAKVKILNGQFESKDYFDEIRSLLLQEFTPKFDPVKGNEELYMAIESSNSICVSIRRGDYESNKQYRDIFSICNKNYYIKALDYMRENVQDPVFFFFSDDIDWVKKNICVLGKCYYESGTDPVWEKLRLMYSCKHFIISNSTFSWWAQYLGRDPNKIVVSPSRWFKTSEYADLIDESFVTIECK